MSSVHNDNEEIYVIEYKEMLFFLFVFIFILVTLFPKGLIKRELFEDNDKDYRLSLVYIKDLLKKEPHNIRLKLLLAKKALLAGESELAFTTASELIDQKERDISKEALLLAYEARKQEYFKTDSKVKKERIQKDLSRLFAAIYVHRLYDDDAAKWYKEAQLARNSEAALFFLKQMLQKNKSDLAHIKEAYYLASTLRRDDEALRYLDILIQKDVKERTEWVRAKYYILLRNKRYTQIERLLRTEARTSQEFAQMLARFYLMRKEYINASNTYMDLMQKAKGYERRKRYFIQAINALRAGGHDAMAARLAKSYEADYLHDPSMRKYMLKLYLAANKLEYAHELALKALHLLKKEAR